MQPDYQRMSRKAFYLGVGLFFLLLVPVFLDFYPWVFFIAAVLAFSINPPLLLAGKKLKCPKCGKHVAYNPLWRNTFWAWTPLNIPEKCTRCGYQLREPKKA